MTSGEIATPVAVNNSMAVTSPVAVTKTAGAHKARFRFRLRLRPDAAGALLRSAAIRLSRLPSEAIVRETLTDLRMPGTWETEVRLRRLVGVCAWALLLGLVGMVLGARVLFGIFTEMPWWYVTLLFALGVPGVLSTVGAFLTLHKGQLPWKLMGIASAAEALTVIATMLS